MRQIKRSLSLGLGIFLIIMGLKKLFGIVPVFALIELHTGLWFSDSFGKYITVALELIAGTLLLIGRRLEGGALAMCILVIALLFHISVIGIYTPLSLNDNAPTTSLLFVTALTAFLVASYVTLQTCWDEHRPILTGKFD